VDAQGAEPEKRHRAIVEQNIVVQLEHAAGYPAVRKALEDRRLELHGWLYDLHGPQVYSYNFKTQQFETV
jgi:carbonic anhydrase